MAGQEPNNANGQCTPDEVAEPAVTTHAIAGTYTSTGLWLPGTTTTTPSQSDGRMVPPHMGGPVPQGIAGPYPAPYGVGAMIPAMVPPMVPPMVPFMVPPMVQPTVPSMVQPMTFRVPVMARAMVPPMVQPIVRNMAPHMSPFMAPHMAPPMVQPLAPFLTTPTVQPMIRPMAPPMIQPMVPPMAPPATAPIPGQQRSSGSSQPGINANEWMKQIFLGNLNFALESNRYVWSIRGHGKDHPKIPIYNIIRFDDLNIIGTFVVNEDKERVDLLDDTGVHLLTANGGLTNLNAMNVSTPSQVQVAIIDNTSINVPATFTSFNIAEQKLNGKSILAIGVKDEPGNITSISAHEDTLRVSASRSLPNLISALISLFAMKMFYFHYQLNRLPMPFGILNNKPAGSFPIIQPTLNVLNPIGDIIVRLSSHLETNREFFVDFLDMHTERIMLVASVANSHVEFMDLAGTAHFTADMRDTWIDVRALPNRNHLYGKLRQDLRTDTSYFTDYRNRNQMKLVRKPAIGEVMIEGSDDRLCKLSVFTQEGVYCIGEIAPNQFTISINMGKELSSVLKAFILATAMQMATFPYKIWRQLSPKVQTYGFTK